MTDILERLRGYNPPDRTTHDRRISQDIHDAADEIERLRAARERDMATTALLRELEWCGFEDGWMGAFCFCPECRRSQDGGHDVDCRLGALLDEVKP